MEQHVGLFKWTASMLFLCLLVVIMIFGQELLIPFTWAFVFFFILHPFCVFLEKRKFSRSLASIIATLMFCVIGGLVMAYLVYQAATILRHESSLQDKIRLGIDSLDQMLRDNVGMSLNDAGDKSSAIQYGSVLKWVASRISGVGKDMVTLTLIPMYLFFILNYRRLVRVYIENVFSGSELDSMRKFLQMSQASIQNYLLGTVMLTGVSAVMSYVILLLFGVHYAFFFAIFIAVLNLIPYIGNLAAFVVVLLFVWVSKESGSIVLFTGITLYISNIVQENFLRPKLVGSKMEMNAMMVFTAVIVGGLIWGFSGMILFIPLLGILQALLSSKEEWKPYTIFFKSGDEPQ